MNQTTTARSSSHTVQTRSGEIHVYEAGTGHPILLLHGSGPGATGWSNFAPNIPALAEQFRVIAPDMPGWGDSAAVTPERRDHVESALHLLDALDIERAAFVGNSMGAMTALTFATVYPDRISHVVTMGGGAPGGFLFVPGNGMTEGLHTLMRAYQDPTPETMRDLVEVMTFDQSFATDELVRLRSEAALKRPDHLENFLKSTIGGTGFRMAGLAEIPSIKAPTLIMHGRDDRVTPFEGSLRLLSLIQDSRLVVVNRCGHWLQLEHADEFNRHLAGFIASH